MHSIPSYGLDMLTMLLFGKDACRWPARVVVPMQAAGRLLVNRDIAEGLQGRQAELFWPDDNMWYLILIERVDLYSQTADIMYSTGETEQLNLNDIVKEGHMSLIN